MSAIATSLTGPRLTDSAFAAAPPPRPPQPMRATWIRSLPAAWTAGIATLAKAETAANLPVVLMNSRRLVEPCEEFMSRSLGVEFQVSILTRKVKLIWLTRESDPHKSGACANSGKDHRGSRCR